MSFSKSVQRWLVIFSLLVILAQGLSLQREGLVFASGRTGGPTTVVFLVRHAEKDTVTIDPPLSAKGRERAVALARLLRKTRIAEIYATQYIRTLQTVRPLCDSLGLRCSVVHVDRDSLEQHAHALTAGILRAHRGDTVLICGHSNTVPLIIKAFGVGDTVSIADTEFDALFLLTIPGTGKPSLARRRFGP